MKDVICLECGHRDEVENSCIVPICPYCIIEMEEQKD